MLVQKSVVVAGHICLDIIPDLNHLPNAEFMNLFQPGRLIEVGAPLFSTGGPVSNTGLALSVLGIPVSLMGKVGDDSFGETVISLVKRFGNKLADGMVVDSATSTSYTVIINPPGLDRIFLHNPGANNTFGPEDLDTSALETAALFHFGYPPLMSRMYSNEGNDLKEVFKIAKNTGASTSLDMSFPDPASASGKAPWRIILQKTLPLVDIFTPSIEELLFTMQPELYESLCKEAGSIHILPAITPELLREVSDEILSLGVKVVLIKLGERGAYLRTTSEVEFQNMGRAQPESPAQWSGVELWAPCFKVNVAGTTGSGDSTIAGFLSALLRDLSPDEALTMSVAVGACNVEAADALGGLQSWEKTIDRVRAGWERLDLEIESSTLRWDKDAEIWIGSRG